MGAPEWDVVVVGGGPAGYTSALRLARRGWKVLLVEKDRVGGTCLNRGCVPSKALIHLARVKKKAEAGSSAGLFCGPVRVDWELVQSWVRNIMASIRNGLELLIKRGGVHLLRGYCTLADEGTVQIEEPDGFLRTVTTRTVIIATGSLPAPLPRCDPGCFVTEEEALFLPSLPSSLIVIGGGPTGLELAWLYAAFGVSVTLVEMMPRILPNGDEEISDLLARSFRKQGITIRLACKVTSVRRGNGLIQVQTDQGDVLTASAVISAVGREPACPPLNIAEPATQVRSPLQVNERFQIGEGFFFAIGDVIHRTGTAHGAIAEGTIVARIVDRWLRSGTLPPPEPRPIVPYAVFSQPEVCGVGMTEQAARADERAVSVGRFPLRSLAPARIESETDGLVKIIVDESSGRVIGVHMIGPSATAMGGEFGLLVNSPLTLEEKSRIFRVHPTWSEGLSEAIWVAMGDPLHTLS